MEKMKFTDKRTALAYAMYMIASSYFKTAKCYNIYMEQKMRIQYREQKEDTQYRLEDICIAYMEKVRRKLPRELFKQNVNVHFFTHADGSIEMFFASAKFILAFRCLYTDKAVIKCFLHYKR